MDYLMTFLEGLLSFISPCVLPMVPIYITYLIGENNKDDSETIKDEESKINKSNISNIEKIENEEILNENEELVKEKKEDKVSVNNKKGQVKVSNKKLYLNSLFFILGFTVVFMILGLFSSALGSFLIRYKLYINIIFGIILLVLGLNFLGIFKIKILNEEKKVNKKIKTFNILTSFVFGLLFAASWTPCVGPFLASAMIRAAGSGTVFNGVILLLLYALGIGIPFFLSAVFLAQLKSTFNFIKKHYGIINKVSGIVIIILGVLKILNIY